MSTSMNKNQSLKKLTIKNTPKKTLEEWYYLLSLGRMLDERAPNYLKQALGWSYHAPYAGHDGIQLALGLTYRKKTDHLFPYYRDMLTVLAAGISPYEIIINGLSKATDLSSGGRHMSNHFAKPEWNIHNVSSSTGNHTLHAVGVARGMKYYKHLGISYSSQGESSLSEGYCYEAINGASREKLPVIFVIQDNGYGISVPKCDQTANEWAVDNFTGFKNLKILHCDGKDIFDSINTMNQAQQIVLSEGIPVIVNAKCVRIGPHSNSDNHELYRDEDELRIAKSQDPLVKFTELLLKEKIFSQKEIDDLNIKAREEVLKAHTLAIKDPDPTPESIHNFVVPEASYVSPTYGESGEIPSNLISKVASSEPVSFINSINQTLKEEFQHNPDTFLWGQDVANKDKGGIFNVTKGMQAMFGKDRIFNAPIAEDFILGTANGLSRFDKKIRVLVEGAEFADYFWPAMEQLVDTSHDYWRSNGSFSPNITIRLASGGYIGGGLYHSQNLEGTFCTLPGLRVVVPAFADDAAGLLRTAMRSEGITLYLEPKALYNAKQAQTPVPPEYAVPFGKAKIRRAGHDLSVITYGNTVHFCLEMAEKIFKETGKQIEVIDLRSLNPLDEESILKSVKKTGRALVVHEDKVFGGFGAEIVALIAQKAITYLDAPILRVGATFTPVGFNRILERAILPNTEKIMKAAKELLEF
jgi:2-oxoisovalerate dehydrogenase E1 component